MSIVTNIEDLPWETRKKFPQDLEIVVENKYNMGPPKIIHPFTINSDNVNLPFAYANQILKLRRPTRNMFPMMNVKFTGTLRPEQKKIRKETLKLLSKGSAIVAVYCGGGKTITSIKIATDLKFKTLVIVNKIVLMKQWAKSIGIFCPTAQVQVLTAKSKKEDRDFYIMNAQNVGKKGKKFFSTIGTVIVDEAHMIMAETLSKSMQYVFPRYLIGLTATPYRPDGLDALLDLYFGKRKVIRKLYCKHIVYKVRTGFTPNVERTRQGRINWGSILDSQATNEERNELIIKILQHFSTKNFLILVKRIAQGTYLFNRLQTLGESVTNLMGSSQEFDTSARILIGTCQKVGVGFDHAKMNALMLATDVEEYFIQYLGRVFRTKNTTPVIFDLVDENGILKNHFKTRSKIYKEHGGTIEQFDCKSLLQK